MLSWLDGHAWGMTASGAVQIRRTWTATSKRLNAFIILNDDEPPRQFVQVHGALKVIEVFLYLKTLVKLGVLQQGMGVLWQAKA